MYRGGENTRVLQSKTSAQITVVTSNISFGHDNNNRSPRGKRGPVTLTEHGNRGAQSPETQFLRQAHSSWLTILISPFIHQIPHYVELLPGCFSPSQTGPGKQPDLQGGSITGRSKVEVALILLHVQNTKKLHVTQNSLHAHFHFFGALKRSRKKQGCKFLF